MKKIQYRFEEGQHKFYGLVGMPEEPNEHTFKEMFLNNTNYLNALKEWRIQVQSIKSTAPEIIEWWHSLKLIGNKEIIFSPEGEQLKDNDIFDLPEGLEFKKCYRSPIGTIHEFQLDSETKVLRIVKAEKEPEESKDTQYWLWDEVDDIFQQNKSDEAMRKCSERFTIQRKKI